jgi:hypothetical protein
MAEKKWWRNYCMPMKAKTQADGARKFVKNSIFEISDHLHMPSPRSYSKTPQEFVCQRLRLNKKFGASANVHSIDP